jgi:hypothetical protein
MISFNEYLSEDISAEMKKAFSTKEKNNLKGLFGKLDIKAENLVFKKADKNVITSYPSSKKEQVIVVKSDWKGKDYRSDGEYTNNFVICDFPKNHTLGLFKDISKSFYVASFEKNTYTLDKIKEHAVEVWVAEVGDAEDNGAGAKIKPELSFADNYHLLWIKAKVKTQEVVSNFRELYDFMNLSYDFKTLYEWLNEYKELGEKFDKRAFSKDESKKIEVAFKWVNEKIENFGK